MMSVTLDKLAQELTRWCKTASPVNGNFRHLTEVDLMNDFANYLSLNSRIKALKEIPGSDSPNLKRLVFAEDEEKAHEGIIAEFIYDSDKKPDEIDSEVLDTTNTLSINNLPADFHSATRCIVGIYNDLNNRSKFHDIEFIEVFHDFEIGCAIKRLR